MYKAIYSHYGTQRTEFIEAESYSHAFAIARKIYNEQLVKVERKH